MPKYRKLPVVIEAIQYRPGPEGNCEEIHFFMYPEDDPWAMPCSCAGDAPWMIHTLEGVMEASPLDYIIKGVNGEFYPCKPDIFEKTYEAVDG